MVVVEERVATVLAMAGVGGRMRVEEEEEEERGWVKALSFSRRTAIHRDQQASREAGPCFNTQVSCLVVWASGWWVGGRWVGGRRRRRRRRRRKRTYRLVSRT